MPQKKDPAAVALGRKRMSKLSKKERADLGAKGGKLRFKGWSEEEIRAEMKRVRKVGLKKQS
jgi:hypothetical protein